VKAVLDAGALVAIDRRDRVVGAQLRVLQRRGTPVRASATVVGQVWRDGRKQANLARVLAGVGTEALGRDDGKRIGELREASDRGHRWWVRGWEICRSYQNDASLRDSHGHGSQAAQPEAAQLILVFPSGVLSSTGRCAAV
jgi:hypothetical protein